MGTTVETTRTGTFIEQMCDLYERGSMGSGLTHRSLAHLLAEHGREFRSVPWSDHRGRGFRRGRARECFMNAYHAACQHDGLTYVEGYADCGVGFPIHHAWCVTEDGAVVDPTWRDDKGAPVEEWEYVGVPLAMSFVERVIFEKETYGVLDHGPIYREGLPAEAIA